MPDKTFKILLLTINGIAAAVMLAAAITLFSVLSENTSPTPAGESVPEQTESVGNNQNYSTPNNSLSQGNEETPVIAPVEKSYIVKEYNGRIAVFLEDEEDPYMELDTRVSELTAEDARLLRQGIRAQNPAELLSILEDYDY